MSFKRMNERRWRGRRRVVVAVTTAVGLAAAALVAVALSGGQSAESAAPQAMQRVDRELSPALM
jgi:hypothetical protein